MTHAIRLEHPEGTDSHEHAGKEAGHRHGAHQEQS
jgi:hypothetical protein